MYSLVQCWSRRCRNMPEIIFSSLNKGKIRMLWGRKEMLANAGNSLSMRLISDKLMNLQGVRGTSVKSAPWRWVIQEHCCSFSLNDHNAVEKKTWGPANRICWTLSLKWVHSFWDACCPLWLDAKNGKIVEIASKRTLRVIDDLVRRISKALGIECGALCSQYPLTPARNTEVAMPHFSVFKSLP